MEKKKHNSKIFISDAHVKYFSTKNYHLHTVHSAVCTKILHRQPKHVWSQVKTPVEKICLCWPLCHQDNSFLSMHLFCIQLDLQFFFHASHKEVRRAKWNSNLTQTCFSETKHVVFQLSLQGSIITLHLTLSVASSALHEPCTPSPLLHL